MNILEAKGLDTYYGQVQILHGLDLSVKENEITTIIGPNGAGKSTALKALFGLVPVREGTVHLDGQDITNSDPAAMVDHGVCFVPQGRAVFPSLSIEENLRMGGFRVRDKTLIAQRMADVFERFPRLAEQPRQAAGSLSGGEQQMLALGRALMAGPRLMLLDEPSVGLAPKVVTEIMGAIHQLRDEGKTIVMVEQNATLALNSADTAYLLVMGTTRMTGPARALLEDPEVRRIYLGGGSGNPDEMASPA